MINSLNNYTKLNISDEAMYHVKAKLCERIKGFGMGEHDDAYYRRIDEKLKDNPCRIGGKEYHSLAAMAKHYYDEYNILIGRPGRDIGGDIPDNEEDLDIFLATNFGV